MTDLSDPIALRLPVDVLADIECVADACDRTRSWVMVRALRYYLDRSGEGGQVLSILRGRAEAAAGAGHDIEDVLSELDAIVRGDDT